MNDPAEQNLNRYQKEHDKIVIEIAVKNSRQLFNERDPAPFRERDLDPKFVIYLLSAIEEFSIRVKMKLRILTSEPEDLKPDNRQAICAAINTYFLYEASLALSQLRKKNRTARYFFLLGAGVLVICLSASQLIESIPVYPRITSIASVGLVIIGWVAMWHPIEALLYDWWPIYEKRQYYKKISLLEVEIINNEESLV